MAEDGLRSDGLDVFEKRLLRVIKEVSPKEYAKLLTKSGQLLMKNAANNTPERSGRLRSAWLRRRWKGKKEWVWQKISKDTVRAGVNVFYAKMVEDGHPLKAGNKEIGFVSGKHCYKTAEELTGRQLPGLARDFLKKIGEELGMDVSG